LFLPKINILAASDQILNITDKLSSVSAKLEIQTQQAQKNETVFLDMQSKITDAKTKAINAQNLVMPLLPSGYPENKSVLQSARTLLVLARKELNTARTGAAALINATH